MSSPILHMIGLAKKAGRLELGEEPVGAAARGHQAKLILVASDAADNTCRRAANFCEYGKQLVWVQLPFTKAELGGQVGRNSLAMLAVTDAGFAASITDKLVLLDPETYSEAAEVLRVKADRAFQRQKEQRQHEKNLLRRKAKPWVAPPKSKQDVEKNPPSAGKKKTRTAGTAKPSTPRPGDRPPRKSGGSKPQTRIGAAPVQKSTFPGKSAVAAKRFTVTRKPNSATPRNEVASNDE